MKVHPSALKHDVAAEDAAQAAEWPLWVEPLDSDGPPDRELRHGFDSQARLLEPTVLILASGPGPTPGGPLALLVERISPRPNICGRVY